MLQPCHADQPSFLVLFNSVRLTAGGRNGQRFLECFYALPLMRWAKARRGRCKHRDEMNWSKSDRVRCAKEKSESNSLDEDQRGRERERHLSVRACRDLWWTIVSLGWWDASHLQQRPISPRCVCVCVFHASISTNGRSLGPVLLLWYFATICLCVFEFLTRASRGTVLFLSNN